MTRPNHSRMRPCIAALVGLSLLLSAGCMRASSGSYPPSAHRTTTADSGGYALGEAGDATRRELEVVSTEGALPEPAFEFSGLPLGGMTSTPEEVAQLESIVEASDGGPEDVPTRSDASGAPLMVYTAQFHVGVYRVAEAQATIARAATDLGGFVASQTDDAIVFRVPAARFFEGVERISGTGDVLHRDVRATDVSEEYRDNDIRLRNLEAMRARLEELLRRAAAIEDALSIERELERVTVELELLRGRQRFLADRVALSTLTVNFRELPHEALDQPDTFALPFAWLRELGLSSLLRVE